MNYNVQKKVGEEKEELIERWNEIKKSIKKIVERYGGQIQEEKGIGKLKREEIVLLKKDIEIEMMRRIKEELEKEGIMKKGKVLQEKKRGNKKRREFFINVRNRNINKVVRLEGDRVSGGWKK